MIKASENLMSWKEQAQKPSQDREGNVTGEEYPHTNLIIGLYLFTVPIVWFLDTFVFDFSTQLTGFIPIVFKLLLAAIVISVSLILMNSTHNILFKRESSGNTLINEGPFSRVRHPLYLSILLFHIGIILSSMSIVALVYWSIYLVIFNKMAAYEEEDLLKIFGKEYLEYKKTVPRWIPHINFL